MACRMDRNTYCVLCLSLHLLPALPALLLAMVLTRRSAAQQAAPASASAPGESARRRSPRPARPPQGPALRLHPPKNAWGKVLWGGLWVWLAHYIRTRHMNAVGHRRTAPMSARLARVRA
eukprot:scaffold23004_cov104-Isochrysis_galbana.AAC.3